jgi:hypothetical protein
MIEEQKGESYSTSLLVISARRINRDKIIWIRYQMEQYMIGVSEMDVLRSNLQDTSGIYKINQNDIGILCDETTGFVKH